MYVSRAEIEARERTTLAPYAVASGDSRGRAYPEEEHPYRTAFQRDRDRIIHTTAFRRLEYKTQVFVYHEGDHYRNRLTHSIEVAQLGRTLARALGANEELTEAICLAHDLGHPAFAHTGEATLNELMAAHGGFDHQQQTLRIVTQLEDRYAKHPGLNLTYEVREGLVKHDTDYDTADAAEYEPKREGSLECQLSSLADEIAYNAADLEDGLRSGLLDPLDVRDLGIWQTALAATGGIVECRLEDKMRTRLIRRIIDIEITNAVDATAGNLAAAGMRRPEDVRDAGEKMAIFSPAVCEMNLELKAFLLARFYRHPRVVRMSYKANRLLTALFGAYIDEPRQLPQEVQARMEHGPDSRERIICDYLAGMTDRYAISEHRRLFDPEVSV